ncbi:TRAM domain-containing protein [Halomarina litorea]|uniref:TRAM domain-containing protein n=1 Tax=Halomarina litorea TaxID=2961595 RepID=UPI0020C33BD0|nr:TRAM domain-containing protein [Halomarina sp. BCD28]
MVEIPDGLRTVFHATIEREDDQYVLEVPASEIDRDSLTAGTTYRVAVLPAQSDSTPESSIDDTHARGPPVTEGELREVTIETTGDQGDGIAYVERGYVVIVPEAKPGDTVTIEIETVQPNVAFATVRGGLSSG